MDPALKDQITRREVVIDRVKSILADNLHLGLTKDEIDLDVALFGTGLGLDSVDALELVVATETAFGVTLPQDALRGSLRTLNSLVDLVLELSERKGAA